MRINKERGFEGRPTTNGDPDFFLHGAVDYLGFDVDKYRGVEGGNMKFFGRTINLKDDPTAIASYKEYHQHVWPEVEGQVGKLGVTKMRIFLLGRRLFMYIETTDDFDPDYFVEQWMRVPKCVAWEDVMQKFQEPLPEAKPGEWWLTMEPVYQYG